MCAGMRDAGNLAWKLGRVVLGQNDDGLLDTYQAERAPLDRCRHRRHLVSNLTDLIQDSPESAPLGVRCSD